MSDKPKIQPSSISNKHEESSQSVTWSKLNHSKPTVQSIQFDDIGEYAKEISNINTVIWVEEENETFLISLEISPMDEANDDT